MLATKFGNVRSPDGTPLGINGRPDYVRSACEASLRRLGVEVIDSDANFCLFGPFHDRHDVWQRLLDRGVLVRETGPKGWLRVSAGTPDETETFYTALAEVLEEIR